MGAVIIIAGIVYVVYKLAKEASVPTNKGYTDFEKFNRDARSGQYTKKQLGKRLDNGVYNTDKKTW